MSLAPASEPSHRLKANPQPGRRKRIAILGSTGSIGRRALDVARDMPERFEVVGLAAGGRNCGLLAEQAREFGPVAVGIGDRAVAGQGTGVVEEAHGGRRVHRDLVELLDACGELDMVLVATVGFAGVAPTLAAVDAGIDVALANKEVLVAAGDLVTARARRSGARVLPVDSEHSALLQCLEGCRGMPAGEAPGANGARRGLPMASDARVRRLTLTASGGPFRGWDRERLAGVGPEEALRHPTWSMGRKISIDSATLMNKGLEVIEAAHLFGVPVDRIDVLVHPESVVHSLVEFVDGAMLAQLGTTDMYLPIQHALLWPDRAVNGVEPLDLASLSRLTFEKPDRATFRCLDLAYEAARSGGTAPAALNAANEVVVERFLAGGLGFTRIAEIVEECLGRHRVAAADSLEAIIEADAWARELARGA